MSALLLPNEILCMSSQAARLLVESGDGDGALLYLALLKCGGEAAPAAALLRWPEERFRSAWDRMSALGLLQPWAARHALGVVQPQGAQSSGPDDRLPEYTREELTAAQEREPQFRGLCRELEGMLGRVFTDNDLKCLYTIYDHLGFSPEVVLLLTGWTIRRERRQKNNPAAVPRMPQVQQAAFRWKRMGIDTLERAEEFLRREELVDQREWDILRAVGVSERRPAVGRERSFISAWVDMGVSDELIHMAYERTVFQKGSMNWSYANKILTSWHAAGLRTPAQVEAGDKPSRRTKAAPAQPQDFQPSQERIQKSNDRLDRFWEEQKKGGG